MSRVVLSGFVLILTAAFVAGCGWRPGSVSLGGSSEASGETVSATSSVNSGRMSIAGSKPVDAYVLLGGRIKSCWFNPDAPLLPNHVYRADVSPDGSKVKITIHQKQALGRPGLATYAIDFKQEGPYTVVTTANGKMPPDLAAKMQFDINRWKRGESNCSKEVPKATAAAPRGNAASDPIRFSGEGSVSRRDIPGCGSRASREGHACRSTAASSGTRRP